MKDLIRPQVKIPQISELQLSYSWSDFIISNIILWRLVPAGPVPVRCSYNCADQQQLTTLNIWHGTSTSQLLYLIFTISTCILRFSGRTLSAVFNVEVDQWDLGCGCSSLTLFVFAAAESMQVWVSLWAASVCDVWACPPPVSAAVDRRRNNTKYAFTSKAFLKYIQAWPGAPFYEHLWYNQFYKAANCRQLSATFTWTILLLSYWKFLHKTTLAAFLDSLYLLSFCFFAPAIQVLGNKPEELFIPLFKDTFFTLFNMF